MTTDVIRNETASRFEATVDGHVCIADYRLHGDVMVMPHTVVPSALQGRGIAAALVRVALEWARAEGLKVEPLCSYVALYMRRHPETQDLLAQR
ncbi:MAG: N-acetyltransferase [Methylibium sp.]|uniref:GNAT family N-acetyltransferase n=1 Tax=Methylibium sp. TaxID=2067992 RepID=UPI0017AF479A|nr:GNAT family N-acetyltransferase [Methylibium sp.]MBA3596054.1 N-acetyltransferase [Methylibium sp.]